MPSERYTISNNVNDSKNTRMDVDPAISNCNVRKDELMHLGRYQKAAQTAIELSKQLKRPLRILDLGCGEIYTMRTLYKSFIVKKSEVVKQYIGVDIDDVMLKRVETNYATLLSLIHGKLITKDITVSPRIKARDDYFDLIIWFEMIEHIKPQFVPPMFDELYRLLNPEGVLLVSTPNSSGSNKRLPKDHVFEWSYDDLLVLMKRKFDVMYTRGLCINMSKVPKEVQKAKAETIQRVYQAFGTNTAFSSTVLGPIFPPKYCKNVLYALKAHKEA